MAFSRNVFFLALDGRTVDSDGVYAATGLAGGTTEVAALSPFLSYYPTEITSSASLTYDTVFGVSSLFKASLFVTNPLTGVPAQLALPTLAGPPRGLVSLGTVALFAARDTAGNEALWRTDGTTAGTVELTPAGANAYFDPQSLARIGNRVVFLGGKADGSRSVWSSDGTNAGTTVILRSAPTSLIGFNPIGTLGGNLLFGVTTNSSGSSVWRTDGSASGTAQVGATDGLARPGAAINGGLLFTGLFSGSVYRTDGASISVVFKSSDPQGRPDSLANFVSTGAKVFYIDRPSFIPSGGLFGGGGGRYSRDFESLVVTDGTTAGTLTVTLPKPPDTSINAPSRPDSLTAFNGRLLFSYDDPTSVAKPRGLWITDSTQAGTLQLAAGIAPLSIDVASIVVDGNRAFVLGGVGPYVPLYVTDGTPAGTTPVPSPLTVLNGGLALDTTRVVATGAHDQYALSPTNAGGLQIADTVGGRDGVAAYPDAHVVAFRDGTGVLDPTGNAGAVARLYEAALGRAPDIGGLIAQTEALDNGTVTLAQISAGAAASSEFIGAHGFLSDADFVTVLYRNADGRAPDAGGLAGYTAALAAGRSRGAILLDIAQSYEARQHSQGIAGQANDATVYRLYEATVGRVARSRRTAGLRGGAGVRPNGDAARGVLPGLRGIRLAVRRSGRRDLRYRTVPEPSGPRAGRGWAFGRHRRAGVRGLARVAGGERRGGQRGPAEHGPGDARRMGLSELSGRTAFRNVADRPTAGVGTRGDHAPPRTRPSQKPGLLKSRAPRRR